MNPSLATLLFAVGIAGLFYLNRDKSAPTSKALWIPVIWLWIVGSRSVSLWLSGAAPDPGAEGAPIDTLIYSVLLLSGVIVLARREQRTLSVMVGNWPIVLYFLYCLMSVTWSDFPGVASKQWVKAMGDLVMALVVVTDPQAVAALRRLFSRVGFLLLPASVLLIKYYPHLGRSYGAWAGEQHNTGVTPDKNLLGLITYVLTLGALWQVLRLWRRPYLPDRPRRLVAQCTLLGFGIWLLGSADSATSIMCFTVGAVLMLLLDWRRLGTRPADVHKLVLTLVILVGLIELTGAYAAIVHALGRNTDLTGRTDIWSVLVPMAPNSLIGAGFESFWHGPRLQRVWDAFPNLHLNEAHNGYLEVFLNLGAVGVLFIIAILIHGYLRAVATFRRDPSSGGLMLACVLSAAMYSYTEAGFRMLSYAWSFLLLAIIAATKISRFSAVAPSHEAIEPTRQSITSVESASVLGNHG
jgi:exopolysaccharide production protein ExoQ